MRPAVVPVPTRRVLDELCRAATADSATPPGASSPSSAHARAHDRLQTALDAHAAALDRIEYAFAAAHGYPRVPLPATTGGTPALYASDPATIARALGADTPAARRLTAELRRRQRLHSRAATAAGLGAARTREAHTARAVSVAAARLLLAPAHTRADLALKLAVLIAAGEHTADDARTFPYLYLRALHAELRR